MEESAISFYWELCFLLTVIMVLFSQVGWQSFLRGSGSSTLMFISLLEGVSSCFHPQQMKLCFPVLVLPLVASWLLLAGDMEPAGTVWEGAPCECGPKILTSNGRNLSMV